MQNKQLLAVSELLYLQFRLNLTRLSLGQDLQVTRDLKKNRMKEKRREEKGEEKKRECD